MKVATRATKGTKTANYFAKISVSDWLHAKEGLEVCAGDACDFLDVDTMKTGERTGYFHNICRLVSFAAVRNWSEIWAIGLDQQTIKRNFLCDRAQFVCFLKSHDAGKRDHEAEIDCFSREIQAATEAVKHTSPFCLGVIGFEDLDCFRLRLTGVNDDWQVALAGGVKLLFENCELDVTW